ncbi:MAG: histidine kinase [Ignavibacteria bacterium CG22_combo_CG10-13_8_21_14_all_37_15]|nr:MAG: histidine kinase [Ignavibacteria bacterium CG22_combo_CG10-13_8_21_14_all_37_15]PIS44318.1 MAG: histidine kinase [Ignavibacteria bacterium CG08_land_8_20_14_0_20_37_9]
MLNNLLKNRNKIYWICQISGWGGFFIFNFLIYLSFGGFNWKRAVTFPYFAFVGISATHVLRVIIKKRKWIEKSPKDLFPRVFLSTFLISFIIVFIIMGINYSTGIIHRAQFSVAGFFVILFNTGILIFLWSIIYFLVHYFENYKKSEIERLVWEAAVKDFELKTLKSQLNPHFMFNALNSIRALIEENPSAAKTAITQLSNIFRYSLKIERTETVPFEEEIKTVEDYLGLEKARFEERLKYEIAYSPDVKNIEIPPMMIQTLVENGIKHGVSKLPEGGFVNVTAERARNFLILEIENSGFVADDAISHAKGYGISNTKQRLHLLYGDQASFSISNVNSHVKVKIILPAGGSNI